MFRNSPTEPSSKPIQLIGRDLSTEDPTDAKTTERMCIWRRKRDSVKPPQEGSTAELTTQARRSNRRRRQAAMSNALAASAVRPAVAGSGVGEPCEVREPAPRTNE
jgi:hypothetical protein